MNKSSKTKTQNKKATTVAEEDVIVANATYFQLFQDLWKKFVVFLEKLRLEHFAEDKELQAQMQYLPKLAVELIFLEFARELPKYIAVLKKPDRGKADITEVLQEVAKFSLNLEKVSDEDVQRTYNFFDLFLEIIVSVNMQMNKK